MGASGLRKTSPMARKGRCRICGKQGKLERHHIISQGHARKTGQRDLISNEGNVVLICPECHKQTTASKSRYLLDKKDKKAKAGNLRDRTLAFVNGPKRKRKKAKKKAGKFDDLRKVYPPDHRLYDEERCDLDLGLDFEIAGGRWTKDGGATLPPKRKRGRRIVIPPPKDFDYLLGD